MRKLLAILAIITTVNFVAPADLARADVEAQEIGLERLRPSRAEKELRHHMSKRGVPPLHYWDAVAQCETGGDWQDHGNWAGGLGIARSTWKGYGGRQFAPTPDKATKTEQIVVALRVALFGFQTQRVFMTYEDRVKNRPFFRPAVGFFGWGCIKNNPHLHPKRWIRNRG